MKLKLTRILLLVTIMAMPLTSHAARLLGPPIAEFFKPQNRVASGVVAEKLEHHKVVMRVTSYLYQNDDDLVTIRVDNDVFDDLDVGEEYVFVFSRLRKNKLDRDSLEVDPEGPALVKTRGVGTPAIFISNKKILTLLAPARSEKLSTAAETSKLIKLAEDEGDARVREISIIELYLRRDLQSEISARNAKRYARLVKQAGPRLKNFLLQGAKHFPEERRASWLVKEFRTVVNEYGTELELNSFVPVMVKNCLHGLVTEGTVGDLETIDRHLYSNAPGVAKAALTALDAIDPQQALVRARRALDAEDSVHLVTRRALTNYIKRFSGA